MLDNLRYEIIKRTDKPENPIVKNPDNQHSSLYDYGVSDHDKGDLLSIRSSILEDSDKTNIYERMDEILVFHEQHINIPHDKKMIRDFIWTTIHQHIKDLGLDKSKVTTKTYEEVLDSIED